MIRLDMIVLDIIRLAILVFEMLMLDITGLEMIDLYQLPSCKCGRVKFDE